VTWKDINNVSRGPDLTRRRNSKKKYIYIYNSLMFSRFGLFVQLSSLPPLCNWDAADTEAGAGATQRVDWLLLFSSRLNRSWGAISGGKNRLTATAAIADNNISTANTCMWVLLLHITYHSIYPYGTAQTQLEFLEKKINAKIVTN